MNIGLKDNTITSDLLIASDCGLDVEHFPGLKTTGLGGQCDTSQSIEKYGIELVFEVFGDVEVIY